MGKTVRELANEFKVSKQAVSKLLTSSFRNNYVTTVTTNGRGMLIVNEDGYKLIYRHFKGEKDRQPTKSTIDSNSTTNLVGELKGQVLFQQAELANKNDQLISKDKQIQELHKLLDQSQQLQLMAENKIKRLENNSTQNGASEGDTLANNEEDSTTKGERGFWSRLFNRRD